MGTLSRYRGFASTILKKVSTTMNVNEFFRQAIALDRRLTNETTEARSFRPMARRRVRMGDGEPLQLDAATHARLCSVLRFPPGLEDRLPEQLGNAVWDNLWKNELSKPPQDRQIPDRMRLSIDGDRVCGFRNADFVVISAANVAEALMSLGDSRFDFSSATVRHQQLDHSGFTVRFSFPTVCAKPRADDIVEGGLELVHSATGHCATRVRNFLYRVVCTNGMTTQVCVGDKTVRLRTRSEKQFAHGEMIASLTLVLKEALNQLGCKMNGVVQLAQNHVNAIEHIEQIATKHRLSKKVVEELKQALNQDELDPMGESDPTMFDVVNALSRVATHGRVTTAGSDDWIIRKSVRESLTLVSGTLAASPVHLCPTCRRILSPSNN